MPTAGYVASRIYQPTNLPVSMDQVCQYMYGYPSDTTYAPDTVARFRNYGDPYSWACYGKPTKTP